MGKVKGGSQKSLLFGGTSGAGLLTAAYMMTKRLSAAAGVKLALCALLARYSAYLTVSKFPTCVVALSYSIACAQNRMLTLSASARAFPRDICSMFVAVQFSVLPSHRPCTSALWTLTPSRPARRWVRQYRF